MMLAVRARLRDEDREDGSLILVLLVMLIAAGLSVLIAGETVRQAVSTRFDAKRVRTLNGAEAGLDAALGQIRGAVQRDSSGNVVKDSNGNAVGDPSKLPCTVTGPVSAAGTASYTVTVSYYKFDSSGARVVVNCTPGSGTGTGPNAVPNIAVLHSDGLDAAYTASASAAAGNRTLETTYNFQTTNANVAGGPIHSFNGSGPSNLCLDAGSDTPVAGTTVQMVTCVAGAVRQKWAYQQNLALVLTSSVSGTTALCVTAGNGTAKTANVVGTVAVLGTCPALTTATVLPSQVWSYDDDYQFTAATASGTDKGNTYLTMTSPNTSGSTLQLTCVTNAKVYTSTSPTTQVTCPSPVAYGQWSPEPTVGSGKAPDAAKSKMGVSIGVGNQGAQLVNYQEFGRCWDVTNQSVGTGNGGGSFLINYPCKQTPNTAGPAWNELLTSSAPGLPAGMLVTYRSADTTKPYCMQSTLTTGTGSSAWVTVVPCPTTGTAPQNLTWTFSGTASYATGYQIRDGKGNCLDLDTTDRYNGWSTLVTNTCSQSLSQKWNAPPGLKPSSTQDLIETKTP